MTALPHLSLRLALVATMLSSAARAADTSVGASTWLPLPSPSAVHASERTDVAQTGAWAAALYMNYDHRPVVIQSASERWARVQNGLGGAFALSVSVGGKTELGLVLPFDLLRAAEVRPPSLTSSLRAPSDSSLGDLMLRAKYAIRPNPVGGLGVAFIGDLQLPTGTREASTHTRSSEITARTLVDYSFLLAGAQASLGYTLRTAHNPWDQGLERGDGIPWRLAAWGRMGTLFKTKLDHRIEVAARGELPSRPNAPFGIDNGRSAPLSPTLVSMAASWSLSDKDDLRLLTALETGVVDTLGSPSLRAVVGLNFTPHLRDADGDGIADDVDACVQAREDFDGFEDEDGCPDIDNDNDGFNDKDDACPNQAGVASEDPRRQGCPPIDSDGDGVPDEDDACPNEKGTQMEGDCAGCPLDDKDSDGIADPLDKCPDTPEDKDGFEDEDGCPEADNDGDGIPDADDHCPSEPGRYSPLQYQSGCPAEIADDDHDLVANENDLCPTEPETWNGFKDGDGCPDKGAEPIWWVATGDDPVVGGFTAPLQSATARNALAARIRREQQVAGVVIGAPTSAKLSRADLETIARELSIAARIDIQVVDASKLPPAPAKHGNHWMMVLWHQGHEH